MIPKEVSLLKKQWFDDEITESEYIERLSENVSPSNINDIYIRLPRGRIRNAFYREVKEWVKPGPRIWINSGGLKSPEWWTPENWSLNQKNLIEAAELFLSTKKEAMFCCTQCGDLFWKSKEEIDCDGYEEHVSCSSCGFGLMQMYWNDEL